MQYIASRGVGTFFLDNGKRGVGTCVLKKHGERKQTHGESRSDASCCGMGRATPFFNVGAHF